MELKRLSISKDTWATPQCLKGEITFGSPIGEVTIVLTESDAKEILRIVSNRLVEQAKMVANNMTTEIIEATQAALPASQG